MLGEIRELFLRSLKDHPEILEKMAKEESKIPVVALCESGRPGFWVMVHSDDLEKVSDIVKKR